MKIEVSLSPALYPYRTLLSHHATVAVDILRASTAVCAAFQAGCDCVVPLDSLECLASYRGRGYKLAAERNGSKVDVVLDSGETVVAEYGNSPTEYLSLDMRGIRLAYSTTNGTISMLLSADAALALVGAFANLSALAGRLRAEDMDVVVLCSGWKNDFCIEDTLFAGALIERISDSGSEVSVVGDAAQMALILWQQAKGDAYAYCRGLASHVSRLGRLGVRDDIPFAFQTDTCPVVPVLKDGRLTL